MDDVKEKVLLILLIAILLAIIYFFLEIPFWHL